MSILRMPAIKAELGHRSHASVYNAIKAGLLTKPVKIGERAVGLPDYEVKAINAARIAGQSETDIRELVNRLHAKRTQFVNA
jgi:prophage regulatory protein